MQVQIDQLLLFGQSLLNAAFPEITLTKLGNATHSRCRMPLADGKKPGGGRTIDLERLPTHSE